MSDVVSDLVVDALASENGDLREANRQLLELVADLAVDHGLLRLLYEREVLARIQGDATIKRLHRLLHRRAA